LTTVVRLARYALSFLAFALPSGEAQTPLDLRIALVIGNAAYSSAPELPNAAKDAAGVASALRSLGFRVEYVSNADLAQMKSAVARVQHAFDKRSNGLAMLYYAGHGIQVDFHNYMVPVDARLSAADQLPARSLDMSSVLEAFTSAGTRMNILVLDACRENPFPAAGATHRGLAPMQAPSGTFLAYATQPGALAEDGDPNAPFGPYAQALILELGRPFAKVEDVFKRVRFQVRRKTSGRQVPWDVTTLEEDFVFNDGAAIKNDPGEVERMIAGARDRDRRAREEVEQAHRREQELAVQAERARQEAEAAVRRKQQEEALAQQEQQALARQSERDKAARAEAIAREREAELARVRVEEAERMKRLEHEAAAAQAALQRERQVREQLALLDRLRTTGAAQGREEQFRIEKQKWDRLRDLRDANSLYDYLIAYPSGAISELAQARLEHVQPARITPQADATGLVQPLAAKRFRLGDRYEFVVRDLLTKTEIERPTYNVIRADDEEAEFDQGYRATQSGAIIRTIGGATLDPYQQWIPAGEYQVGRKWHTRSILLVPGKAPQWVELTAKVLARETIEVPAGRFDTFKMEMEQVAQDGTRLKVTYWGQPDWGVAIKQIREIRDARGQLSGQIYDLTARSRRP
jgi:uncharacterized caspase-like protein